MQDLTALLEDTVSKSPGCNIIANVRTPVISLSSVKKNRELCAKNICGNYGKSHTCPPLLWSAEECISKVDSYERADVVTRTYTCVDLKNRNLMMRITSDFQSTVRDIMHIVRKEGYDCFALADGPCNFCERCSALDGKNCIHPEEQIPSVSGYGVDMASYIASIGRRFEFKENEVTFYGIILTNNKN